ncbi:unnamed protein product [Prunus brigantina]
MSMLVSSLRGPRLVRQRHRQRRERDLREQSSGERNDQRPLAYSRTSTRQQAVEESSQAQPSYLPCEQGNQGDRLLGAEEEVSQSRLRHRRCRPERPSLQVEDVDRRPPARSRTNTQR